MRSDPQSCEQLRERYYNATVLERVDVTPGLMILRILPDQPFQPFIAGQYTTLGLGLWEPRVDGVASVWDPADEASVARSLVRRAYSLSAPVWHGQRLAGPQDVPFLEFYIAQVTRATDQPPLLTPRLFGLRPGSRLHVGARAHGRYTTSGVAAHEDVGFFATGTGEAPHNAMLSDLLARGHTGRIVSAVCVRHRRELGYLTQHRELERRFSNYRYLVLTTREPENLNPEQAGFVGRQYLQDFVESGRLEQELGYTLRPETTHVFLCGNPAMIGMPGKTVDGQVEFPEPPGLVEVFVRRGFVFDSHDPTSRVHLETYW